MLVGVALSLHYKIDTMNTCSIEQDIEVYCITADSFPDGVKAAHEQLHSLIPFSNERKYFGISFPGKDDAIIYKAAANELNEGELQQHSLEKMTIKKGDYLFIDIENYMKNIPAFESAFNALTADKRIDPNGFCVEWYKEEQLCRCMVKMK